MNDSKRPSLKKLVLMQWKRGQRTPWQNWGGREEGGEEVREGRREGGREGGREAEKEGERKGGRMGRNQERLDRKIH
jgi:hypothetical protein